MGHLVHGTKVMPLGKAFLNRLFPILHALRPGHRRRLDLAAREDLAWWQMLCDSWLGSSVHQFIALDQLRLGLLGLWRMVPPTLVPSPMARLIPAPLYRPQGTFLYCGSSSYLGAPMVRIPYSMPLGQFRSRGPG